MADKKVTDLGTPSGGVASGDKLYLVDVSDTTDNAAGSSRADTMANVVTKAHGLSDGIVKVATGTMVTATAGTDYYAPGSKDVAVADGGTGSSTASGARTNLGLVISTDVQAYDTDLNSLAGLTLAQGDILYRNGTQLTNLAAGSSGQFLSTGGAGANVSWASGALTTYDAIVAPSGGNYTSLSAAITAGKTRIFIKDGTYTETTTITIAANTHIIGESLAAVVSLSTSGVINITGTKVEMRNFTVQFNASSTTLRVNANDALFEGMRFDYTTTTNSNLSFSTTSTISRIRVLNCFFDRTSSTSSTTALIQMSGSNNTSEVLISNNIVNGYFNSFVAIGTNNSQITISNNSIVCSLSAATAVITSSATFNGGGIFITGNNVTMAGSSTAVSLSSNGVMVTNNWLANGGTAAATISLAGGNCTVTGNTFSNGGPAVSLSGNGNVVSGNMFISSATGVTVTAANQTIVGNYFSGVTTPLSLSTNIGILSIGNYGVDSVNNKEIVVMKNTSGATINAGNVVTLKAVAAGNEVTTTTTAADTLVFGMAEAAISNNATGNILVKGKTVLLKADGTTDIAVGDFLTTFTTAGIVQKAVAGQTAIAIALEAYATNDSNGVIDALIISPRII
jgi:hypothetical protein